MGKKSKPDEPEQFEVWIFYETGKWKQVQEDGDPIFKSKNRALLIGQSKSQGPGVVEVMVILRRPIATFNGEAISQKGRIKAVEKKEPNDAAVQRGGEEADKRGDPADEHVREAAPGGAGREGAPEGSE